MADQKSGRSGGAGTGANRDRSDLKGSPGQSAETSGERGSGRSDSNAPAPERNTREKQKP